MSPLSSANHSGMQRGQGLHQLGIVLDELGERRYVDGGRTILNPEQDGRFKGAAEDGFPDSRDPVNKGPLRLELGCGRNDIGEVEGHEQGAA